MSGTRLSPEAPASPGPHPSPGTLAALGAALVAQFVTSLVSGVLFLGPLVDTSDAAAVARHTVTHLGQARAGIALDVVTALVVAGLGVLFAAALDHAGPVAARVAAGLYLVEASLLATSKVLAFGFVRAAEADAPLTTLAPLLETAEFAYALHMVAFCAGALVFYALLVRARVVPRWLAWWGLVALVPVAAGTLLGLAGVGVPFSVMLPYAPFELVAGVWLLVRGVRGVTAAG